MGRADKIISRLDAMLTDAINGSFIEASYDETELSRLESKFRQYLTGKEMAGERVERERAAIKELVTNISHQTKTPVANICLYSQLLEERSTPEMLPLVEQIRLQADKLDFLIKMLTKISRLESNMIELKPQIQPVAPLLVGAVQEAQGQGDAKGILIRVEGEEEGLIGEEAFRMDKADDVAGSCAYYDLRWTGEALGNVLDNAVKYSPEGGTVTISLQALEMFVCIRVEDEGMGIPEEETARIFERFYRGKRAVGQEGNGVGLYLTRMILQRERGYIKVSPGKNGGSCFCIYLSKTG